MKHYLVMIRYLYRYPAIRINKSAHMYVESIYGHGTVILDMISKCLGSRKTNRCDEYLHLRA